MSTIALKKKAFAGEKDKVSFSEKAAACFKMFLADNVPKVICCMLALTGNKSAFRTYQMLRELER